MSSFPGLMPKQMSLVENVMESEVVKFFPYNVELLWFSPNGYFETLREDKQTNKNPKQNQTKLCISHILKKKLKPIISWILKANYWYIDLPDILGRNWGSDIIRCWLCLYMNHRHTLQSSVVLCYY